ncbi:MAG: class I SAM-dependent methyltransferase [Bacilli bacterium]
MEKNLFDQLSHKYDSKKQLELAAIIQEEIRTDIANSTNKTMLDYGCGTGLVSLAFSESVKKLILTDASSEMIRLTNQKIGDLGIQNASTHQLDLIKDTTDIKADIILASLLLLHVPDTTLILSRLFDVLNENGRLIIVDFDLNQHISDPRVHNGFDQEKLAILLKEIGFSNVTSHNFYQGKELFMKKEATLFKAVTSK